MNFLSGLKTYILGGGALGSILTSGIAGLVPVHQLVTYGLLALMMMALRSGVKTETAKLAEQVAIAADKSIANPAIKPFLDDLVAAFKQALAANPPAPPAPK